MSPQQRDYQAQATMAAAGSLTFVTTVVQKWCSWLNFKPYLEKSGKLTRWYGSLLPLFTHLLITTRTLTRLKGPKHHEFQVILNNEPQKKTRTFHWILVS